MRSTFAKLLTDFLDDNQELVVLLGDIGVHSFQEALEKHPLRVYNIGILEQSTIGIAAGLAKSNLIPIVHTIAPFIVERALEQIKIDFAYQNLRGNLVSVGGSLDYAALGCTHHCPGDISILLTIPNIEILIPGTDVEFARLFSQTIYNNSLTYHRLSEISNEKSSNVNLGKGDLLKQGNKACILVFGPMRDEVEKACQDLDVTILYYTTIQPFDVNLLIANLNSCKIILVEPFYEYSTAPIILKALEGRDISITSIGIPREFIRNYGSVKEHLQKLGLFDLKIREKIVELIGV